MKFTNRLGLALYDPTDKMTITTDSNSLNSNMKIIDEGVAEVKDTLSELETDFKNYKKYGYNLLDVAVKNGVQSNISISGSLASNGIKIVGNTGSGVVAVRLTTDAVTLKAGKRYHLFERIPADNISSSTYRLDVRNADNLSQILTYERTSKGTSFTVDKDTDVILHARIASGYSINATIYPMLMEIDESDNLLDEFAYREGRTESGFVISQENGNITINGSNTTTTALELVGYTNGIMLVGGQTYVIKSSNNNGIIPSADTYRLDIRNSSGQVIEYETSANGFIFTPTETAIYGVFARINANYRLDNVVIRPTIMNVNSLSVLVPDVARIKTEQGIQNRRLDAHDKLLKGQLYDVQNVVEHGATNPPSGSVSMSLVEHYGHSIQGADPSPTNKQEIVGVESIHVKHIGKNHFDGKKVIANIGATPSFSDNILTATCQNTSQYTSVVYKCKCEPNTRYTISVEEISPSASNNPRISTRGLDSNGTQLIVHSELREKGSASFTTLANEAEIQVIIYANDTGTASVGNYIRYKNIMLEKNISATEYEPYKEQLFTVDLPRTMYKLGDVSDTIDVDEGIYRYDCDKIDLGILPWNYVDAYQIMNSTLPKGIIPQNVSGKTIYPCLCEYYKPVLTNVALLEIQNNYIATAWFNLTATRSCVVIKDTRYTNANSFKSYMSGKHVVYRLATQETAPIPETDLNNLRSLLSLPSTDNVFVTDQNGNAVDFLNEYIVSLRNA